MSLTLAEVVYVLESVYEWNRSAIADHLNDLIAAEVLEFPEEEILVQALKWYRAVPSVHFADAYVAAAAARENSVLISFDRDLRRIPELTVIQHVDDLK